MKIIFVLLLVILLAGCTHTEEIPPPYENGDEIVRLAYNEEPENREIPRYNEYRVSLEIDPASRTASGLSHITFTNRAAEPLSEIVLRVYLNAFSEGAEPPPVFYDMEWRAFPGTGERDYGRMEIQFASLDAEPLDFTLSGTVLALNLPEPLEPNATVQLLLQYTAEIPLIAHRTGGNNFALWFGMFLPVLAVFDNETGWHTEAHYPAGTPFLLEPANFIVEITTPARYIVVGPGLRREEILGDTDTKITHFEAHQARDFAFAVSPHFQHAHTTTESGVDIHFYYFTNSLQIDEILDAARISMEFFENNVGAYPLGHVTIIEASMMQDSLSFSQVVFVDTRHLGGGGPYQAIAHGLGNQWFANIVGTNRIAEPWLTNGLTRFVQAGIFYPTPDDLRARMVRDFSSIEARTTLYLSRGLYASPNWAHYAHTHGRKAQLMLYALHYRIGDVVFRELIAEYYQRFSFNIATANDFIELAEELSGENLQDFFNEWLNTGTVPPLERR